MEFGFFFKLAVGIWFVGILGYVVSKYEMQDKYTASITILVSGVLGTIAMIIGLDLNPDKRPYYWNWNTARIADGICIAQETEMKSPGKLASGKPINDVLMTRYVCKETEFWRRP